MTFQDGALSRLHSPSSMLLDDDLKPNPCTMSTCIHTSISLRVFNAVKALVSMANHMLNSLYTQSSMGGDRD